MSERAVRRERGQRKAPTADIYELPEAVSAREAAAALGVSERTVRRAIDRGEIATVKQGRSFRIPVTALDEYQADRGQHRRRRLRVVTPQDAGLEQAAPPPTLTSLVGGDLAGRQPLPSPLTAFVGRAEVAMRVASLLRDEDV